MTTPQKFSRYKDRGALASRGEHCPLGVGSGPGYLYGMEVGVSSRGEQSVRMLGAASVGGPLL